MSCTRHVESFEVVDVKIEFTADKECLRKIEETAEFLLKQKLDKLNILLKNLNVYCHNNTLLVNDRYNICKDFEEIATTFGLSIKHVACPLKGKNFIVSDKLIEILMTIHESYQLEGIANQELTADIQEVINKNSIHFDANDELTLMLRSIRDTGVVVTQGKQRVVTTYYDDLYKGEQRGEIVIDKSRVDEMVKDYVNKAKGVMEEGNKQLRDGTAKLLYSRARQMGYAVTEEKKGNQIQLVLVRCE